MKENKLKSLFIIMPFGMKKGKLDHFDQNANTIEINFDKIWKSIIQPSIPDSYVFKRADELKKSGPIDRNYIDLLISSDIVLADLTFGNPNVYYELGIRHVLSKKGTVLVAQSGTKLPFDVRNQSVLYYDNFDASSLVEFQKSLTEYIDNSFKHKQDSPVHIFFPELNISFDKDDTNMKEVLQTLEVKNIELTKEVNLLKTYDQEKRFVRKIIETNDKSRLISIYGQLMKSGLKSIEPYELLGVKLQKNSLLDQAIITLNKAIEIDPNDPEVNRELGFVYRKKNKFEQAKKYFTLALELNEEDPELLGMLGGMYKREGKLDDSLTHYIRAYDLETENLYSTINVATLKLILEGTENGLPYFEEAIRISLSQIEENKQDYWTYFCLAQSYIFLETTAELSIKTYSKAIELNPPLEDIKSEYEHIDFLRQRNIEKDKIIAIQNHVFKMIMKSS